MVFTPSSTSHMHGHELVADSRIPLLSCRVMPHKIALPLIRSMQMQMRGLVPVSKSPQCIALLRCDGADDFQRSVEVYVENGSPLRHLSYSCATPSQCVFSLVASDEFFQGWIAVGLMRRVLHWSNSWPASPRCAHGWSRFALSWSRITHRCTPC